MTASLRPAYPPAHLAGAGTASKPQLTALVALGAALRDSGYRFTTVTPATHERVNARDAAAAAADLTGVFGWSRPFARTLPTPELMALMAQADALVADGGALRSRLRASTLDGNLYLHSAYPTTAPDAVFFGPDTYRFVRALRAALPGLGPVARAVDIGCGAGPGAVTIARAHPAAIVYAADINPAALLLAEANAHLAGTPNVVPVESNLLGALDGSFDLIVSNPPYLLDRAKRAYRNGGGELGAGLSIAVVREAIERLVPGGTLLLYTGVAMVGNADAFQRAVEALLRSAGFRWTYEEIDPDVFGEELEEPAYAFSHRIAAVWLCATKPGACREQH